MAGIENPLGVEVGVFTGVMSREMLKTIPSLTLFLVDSWKGTNEQPMSYKECDDYHAKLSAKEQESYFRTALNIERDFFPRAFVLRQDSAEAARQFTSKVDFVFIDADHSYEGCKTDIEAWTQRVRAGGWLCGHDYDLPTHPKFGVKRAVDEAVAANNWQLELGSNYTWFVKL